MWSEAKEVAAGDIVIVWMTRDMLQPMEIVPGKELNNRFGNYRHADLVGLPYGSKVGSRNGKGFVHILRPTPELWTMALPHRTQILYMADIAFVSAWLDIKRGSRVIEAGTGSGSFSHSVARSIGREGKLWTYEFHEQRAEKAKQEFQKHGMLDTVIPSHRDVCKDGFEVENTADAVFLDLPAPWKATAHAKLALRKDKVSRICCFSPCIEQVLRTVTALNDAGFTGITMYETLIRPHDVSAVPAPVSVSDITAKLKLAEQRREEKRQRQIANAKLRKAAREGVVEGTDSDLGKRKRGLDADDDDDGPPKSEQSPDRTADPVPRTGKNPGALESTNGSGTKHEMQVAEDEGPKVPTSKVLNEVRGHTSYLTFAMLVPPLPTEKAFSSGS